MQDKQDKSNFRTSENKNITVLHSLKCAKGDIIKTERGKGNDMDYNTDSKNVYSKNEIDLKLEKINSDIQHGFEKIDLKSDQLKQEMRSGFEKIDLKFDNFEKRVETMFLTQENKRLEDQARNKKEFMYWFIGLLVSTILGILAIIVTILTTK